MDLVDFLRQRLDEDAAAAHLVLHPYGDAAASNDAEWWPDERVWFEAGFSSDESPLLTRMTPQRVLAEVEAKRRIIDLHCDAEDPTEDRACRESWGDWNSPEECATLRALAQPYADHPAFQPEWKL